MSIGSALDQTKAKYKIVLDDEGGLMPATKYALCLALDQLRLLVEHHPAVDRGHRHSSGSSEVAIWVRFRHDPGTDTATHRAHITVAQDERPVPTTSGEAGTCDNVHDDVIRTDADTAGVDKARLTDDVMDRGNVAAGQPDIQTIVIDAVDDVEEFLAEAIAEEHMSTDDEHTVVDGVATQTANDSDTEDVYHENVGIADALATYEPVEVPFVVDTAEGVATDAYGTLRAFPADFRPGNLADTTASPTQTDNDIEKDIEHLLDRLGGLIDLDVYEQVVNTLYDVVDRLKSDTP